MGDVWKSAGRALVMVVVLAVVGVIVVSIYAMLLFGPGRSSPVVLWVDNREEATLRGGRIYVNGGRSAVHLLSPVRSGVRAKFVFSDLGEQDVSLVLHRRDGTDRGVELGYPSGGETLSVSIVAQGDSLRLVKQVRKRGGAARLRP